MKLWQRRSIVVQTQGNYWQLMKFRPWSMSTNLITRSEGNQLFGLSSASQNLFSIARQRRPSALAVAQSRARSFLNEMKRSVGGGRDYFVTCALVWHDRRDREIHKSAIEDRVRGESYGKHRGRLVKDLLEWQNARPLCHHPNHVVEYLLLAAHVEGKTFVTDLSWGSWVHKHKRKVKWEKRLKGRRL